MYSAIESFVEFCDEMIAEEGLFDRFKKKKNSKPSSNSNYMSDELTKEQIEKLKKYLPLIQKEFSRIEGIDFYPLSNVVDEVEDINHIIIAMTELYPNGNASEEELDEANEWVDSIEKTCKRINAKYREIHIEADWDKYEALLEISLR